MRMYTYADRLCIDGCNDLDEFLELKFAKSNSMDIFDESTVSLIDYMRTTMSDENGFHTVSRFFDGCSFGFKKLELLNCSDDINAAATLRFAAVDIPVIVRSTS